jgi:hypothetical protein
MLGKWRIIGCQTTINQKIIKKVSKKYEGFAKRREHIKSCR